MNDSANAISGMIGLWIMLQLAVLLAMMLGGLYALFCLNRAASGMERLASAIEDWTAREAEKNGTPLPGSRPSPVPIVPQPPAPPVPIAPAVPVTPAVPETPAAPPVELRPMEVPTAIAPRPLVSQSEAFGEFGKDNSDAPTEKREDPRGF